MKETIRKGQEEGTGRRKGEEGDWNELNNKEGPLRRGQEGGDRIKWTGRGTGMKETIINSQEGKDQEGRSMNTVLGWEWDH